MCRKGDAGPCGDPNHHPAGPDGLTLDGPRAYGGRSRRAGTRDALASLPPRVFPDAGPLTARRRPRRRGVLAGLSAAVAVACGPGVASTALPAVVKEEATEVPTQVPEPTAVPTVVPEPTAAPTPVPPRPKLTKLGPGGIVQPLYAADGSRILYYDQPAPGRGGTWSIDPATGQPQRERGEWGYYVANGTLLALARPNQRDTWVRHLPSGREWTLPTTNATVFSSDGTVVAYTGAAAGQPGGPPPSPGQGFSGQAAPFQLTTITVSGADGQYAQRVQLPINGSVLAWLPAPEDTPNARLLLSGRKAERDDPSLWAYDVRDRSLVELARSKRLTGILPSPDGTWVAHVAMWNSSPSENGLWLTRTDGSVRRRVELVGGYRWTRDNRLLTIPIRTSGADSHQLWEVAAESGAARRLLDPAQVPFRVSNCDWDCAPDGSGLVFVSADDKGLWHLAVPEGLQGAEGVPLPVIQEPAPPGSNGRPYRLPFTTPPGPSSWYVAQWYGVTTGGYRGRNSTYVQGQGIHFGIDFATACGTPVVAVANGTVIAVDGDYGSPPHNVVLKLDDGNIAMYGHLVERTRHVAVGQRVVPGQVVGNTGDSIAPYNCTRNPHLHLEIRKQGRATATNPVPFFDANWDDLSLGVWPGPRFEKNLDDPKKFQFLDDQPDIYFGGPIITNFARPWPV